MYKLLFFFRVVILKYLFYLPVGIFSYVFLYFGSTGEFPGVSEWTGYLMTIVITVGCQLVITKNNGWLDKRIDYTRSVGTRFVLGFVLNLFGVLLIAGTGIFIYLLLFEPKIPFLDSFTTYSTEWIKVLILHSTIMLIYSVSYFAFYSINKYSRGEIELIQRKRKQLELQLEVLKSQLSPHFLFNSLNTISALIYKDVNLAEDFIRGLAQSYRYILNTNDKISVTLEEEVEFVKSFHYLLKVRFENYITLEINLTKEVLQTEIPPLTLQMLVENAVKHNRISKSSPLSIQISAVGEKDLRIANSKNSKTEEVQSLHIGIENIRRRYSFLTDRDVKVFDRDEFVVQIPLLLANQ